MTSSTDCLSRSHISAYIPTRDKNTLEFENSRKESTKIQNISMHIFLGGRERERGKINSQLSYNFNERFHHIKYVIID